MNKVQNAIQKLVSKLERVVIFHMKRFTSNLFENNYSKVYNYLQCNLLVN